MGPTDVPPAELRVQLRSGSGSTRQPEPVPTFPSAPGLAGVPPMPPGVDEIYVEETAGKDGEKGVPRYEDRVSALPAEVYRQIRRRAWEEYARRVADCQGERRLR